MSKRLFDVVGSAVALVATAPLLLGFAIAVRMTSPGPAIHRATRVGRHGVPFTLLKLRSMRTDPGPALTAGGDARVTGVGRFLRRTKLDELPQLWNVIRGDMSLVGPRPEDPRYVEWYTPEQLGLLEWRPGLTSPASVTFRDEERVLQSALAGGATLEDAYREVLASKLAIELAYFPQATFGSDLRWLLRTALAVVP